MCINVMQGSDVIFLAELRPMLVHVVTQVLSGHGSDPI